MFVAVGVFAAKVEQIDAREDDEEAAEEGDGVDGGCGVEALEEETGCDEGAGGEADVVKGVDNVGCELAQGLVEVIHLCQNAACD